MGDEKTLAEEMFPGCDVHPEKDNDGRVVGYFVTPRFMKDQPLVIRQEMVGEPLKPTDEIPMRIESITIGSHPIPGKKNQ